MNPEQFFLSIFGDPVEKESAATQLGRKFPRYAEFWLHYVYPNRRLGNDSKLQEEIPPEIEDLFNTHYSVWYQLTVTYRQLNAIDNSLVEIGDLFFHLATAIDLIERTFVLVLEIEAQLQGNSIITKLTQEDYNAKIAGFWTKQYPKGFKSFKARLKPVSIRLHDVSSLFQAHMPNDDVVRAFVSTANRVRQYRNQLTHNVSPLNIVTPDGRMIPKPEHIQHYAGGRYSSITPDLGHFELASQVIQNLVDDLLVKANGLWETLLRKMTGIATSPQYEHRLKPHITDSEESGVQRVIYPAHIRYPPYTGGTIDFTLHRDIDFSEPSEE